MHRPRQICSEVPVMPSRGNHCRQAERRHNRHGRCREGKLRADILYHRFCLRVNSMRSQVLRHRPRERHHFRIRHEVADVGSAFLRLPFADADTLSGNMHISTAKIIAMIFSYFGNHLSLKIIK